MDREIARKATYVLSNPVFEAQKTFKEYKTIKRKELLELKLKTLIYHMEQAKKYLIKADEEYRELINKTEYFEKNLCHKFNFKVWNMLRKTRGHFTRYLNNLYIIQKIIKKEKEETQNGDKTKN